LESSLVRRAQRVEARIDHHVAARAAHDEPPLGGHASDARTVDARERSLELARARRIDLDEIGWGPSSQDVYTALVYSISGLHVTDVMVDGAWLMCERRLRTVDYGAASAGLEEALGELRGRKEEIRNRK